MALAAALLLVFALSLLISGVGHWAPGHGHGAECAVCMVSSAEVGEPPPRLEAPGLAPAFEHPVALVSRLVLSARPTSVSSRGPPSRAI